jgi:hypothetical protein
MRFMPLLRTLLIPAALTWCAMPNAHAAERRIECPAEIPRQEIRIASAPAGWTPFVPFEYRNGVPLTSAGVMYGPPSIMAISKPTSITKTTEKWTEILAAHDGAWMACFYGDEGRRDFILSQRLPDTTTECTVNYAPPGAQIVRLDIRCR